MISFKLCAIFRRFSFYSVTILVQKQLLILSETIINARIGESVTLHLKFSGPSPCFNHVFDLYSYRWLLVTDYSRRITKFYVIVEDDTA